MKSRSSFIWGAQGNESYGVVAAITNLASQVRANGHSVSFVLFERGAFYDFLRSKGFDCDLVEVGMKLSIRRGGLGAAVFSCVINGFRMLRVSCALQRYLSRRKPDYFHIVPNVLVVPGAIAARLSGVNVIFEMSNALSDVYAFDLNRRLYRWACRFSKCLVLANSAYSGTTIAGRGVVPVTFHLGVDAERFKPRADPQLCRVDFGLNEDDFVVGLIARFSVEKGQLTLVQALNQARKVNPRLRALLVGGPGSESYLAGVKAYVTENQLEDCVVFAGSSDHVEDYYELVDITVNLRPDPEPFGLSVIESMFMRKPVLVHALGGPAETVIDGETGWHLGSVTPEAVAARLVELADSSVCLDQLEVQAGQHAEKNFSLEAQYSRYSLAISEHFCHKSGGQHE